MEDVRMELTHGFHFFGTLIIIIMNRGMFLPSHSILVVHQQPDYGTKELGRRFTVVALAELRNWTLFRRPKRCIV